MIDQDNEEHHEQEEECESWLVEIRVNGCVIGTAKELDIPSYKTNDTIRGINIDAPKAVISVTTEQPVVTIERSEKK